MLAYALHFHFTEWRARVFIQNVIQKWSNEIEFANARANEFEESFATSSHILNRDATGSDFIVNIFYDCQRKIREQLK